MIALNELIKNRETFENKYHLMGKRFNLNKIIELEKKFIVIDERKNKARALCNKMCAEVADVLNEGKSSKALIQQINELDRNILYDDKKCKKSMQKINRKLKKLPNLPLGENILNLSIKTEPKIEFSRAVFIDYLKQISNYKTTKQCTKKLLNSMKNMVLQEENLPQIFEFNKRNRQDLLVLVNSNAKEFMNQIITCLSSGAKYIFDKSIKLLKASCSREILAILSDGSTISVEFIGEYLSRNISLKFYDKNIDMTKFVNIIKIKCHG